MTAISGAARDGRALALVAYLTTWLGGLFVLLFVRKDRHELRWHAWQAFGLGLVGLVLFLVALALTPILFVGEFLDGTGPAWYATIGGVGIIASTVAVLVLLVALTCAIAAVQGRRLRLPLVARLADHRA